MAPRTSRTSLAAAALLALAFLAGCGTPAEDGPTPATPAPTGGGNGSVPVLVDGTMAFRESVVRPAVGLVPDLDLFEPSIDVSDRGVIYVAGHVLGALTTGTPAYVSRDDGATWEPMPFLGDVATPSPGQWSSMPLGDEGYIAAGDGGRAWMVDINLATMPVTGWCDDGREQCMLNANAFDRAGSLSSCAPGSVNDRAWLAYANGTLLLVNNGNTGHVQVGVLPVGQEVGPARWNLCLSPGGFMAGVPALRGDGVFAVPQRRAGEMAVVLGHVDRLEDARAVPAFAFENVFVGMDGNAGRAAFDGMGTLFVAALNNSAGAGGLRIAASADDGATFAVQGFTFPGRASWMHLDSRPELEGAMVSWAQESGTPDVWDYYAGHVVLDADGLRLQDVSLAAPRVVGPFGDLMGNAVGPDGRAYVVVYTNPGAADYPLSNPVRVWVQEGGPTLQLR